MKPAPFLYEAPTSVAAALDMLAEHGWDAKLLAGGQSLVPTMNFRLAQPAVLLDLNRIEELAYVDAGDDVVIGAMTRQAEVEHSPVVATGAPLLAAAMPHIAHAQIRNRGTIGGSLAHADPAAELPAVAVACDARITVRNKEGERQVAAADFFLGLFATVLAPEDLLVEVAFPRLSPGTGWGFQEIARRHGDYALVGAAVRMTIDDAGCCSAARIVLFSVGGAPVVAEGAEVALLGGQPDTARLTDAARIAAQHDIDPVGDIHASVAFKRHLAEVVVRRALGEAAERARATTAEAATQR